QPYGHGAESHLGRGKKIDRGIRTFRSSDPVKENRGSREIYEKSPPPLQTGGTIKRVDHAAVLRDVAQFLKKTTTKAPGIAKNDGFVATALSSFLPQAESYGRICTPGGRRAPYLA